MMLWTWTQVLCSQMMKSCAIITAYNISCRTLHLRGCIAPVGHLYFEVVCRATRPRCDGAVCCQRYQWSDDINMKLDTVTDVVTQRTSYWSFVIRASTSPAIVPDEDCWYVMRPSGVASSNIENNKTSDTLYYGTSTLLWRNIIRIKLTRNSLKESRSSISRT